jgi:UDP-N-acetyl-D-mannosaminuronic acid dehydrogenase
MGDRSGQSAVADCLAASNKRASELKIACFGLAFKPNIDDLRESPAMEIAAQIARWHSGETLVVEPNIHQLPKNSTDCARWRAGRGAGERRCAGDAGRS